MKRSILRLVLLSLPMLVSTPAFAKPAGKPGPSLMDSLQGPAKNAFTSAQVLLNNNDPEGALTKYQQAYDLSKDPRLLFNMALCARSLKAYARMQSFLVRYERAAGTGLSRGERADVDAALAAIQSLIGTLNLTVNEAGAAVSIDGQYAGSTPFAAPLAVDLGAHTLTVTKPGFAPLEQPLTIVGGSEVPLSLTLTPQRHGAQLTVSSGATATVVVDDTAAVVGRFDGPLPPGTHEVRVTEPGKIAYHAQIDLRDGETRTIEVTLESEKHGGPIWPWIAGGAAVVAGGAVGGYFLFRSPSTIAGTPPTGSTGSVTFSSVRRR